MAVKWPQGFSGAGIACGIKDGEALDAGLLVADEPAKWAGVFTRNAAAAACVTANRARLGREMRALVVNSGNANACTGIAGEAAVTSTTAEAAALLGCTEQDVLVASTGVIGVQLPVEKLTRSLPSLKAGLTDDVEPFARSIMTTDTVMKVSEAYAGPAQIVGVAKGAAMLAPNMATMLAFITTDAALEPAAMQEILTGVVDRTFNRICVDACESTNDSVIVIASGREEVEPVKFESSLEQVCSDLAEQMIFDAEGGTKVVRLRIEGAADESGAVELGKAVASSVLWRSAVYGGDPNWGRILSALGVADRSLDLSSVTLAIGDEVLFAAGEPRGDMDAAAAVMKAHSYEVSCRVGGGPGKAELLTTDLSPEYVNLNAGGLS